MNMPVPVYNTTLFDLEVLRARLEIRDFFLKAIYREVYENIGQLLSLVRVMLAHSGDRSEPASELVGKAIREMREMCRSFYPDEDLLKENGFPQAVSNIIAIIFPGSGYLVQQIDITEEMGASLKLIVFSMLLEVLHRIRAINGRPALIAITGTRKNIECLVHYKGEPIRLDEYEGKLYNVDKISLQQKARLINARFDIVQQADGSIHLKLLCPLN